MCVDLYSSYRLILCWKLITNTHTASVSWWEMVRWVSFTQPNIFHSLISIQWHLMLGHARALGVCCRCFHAKCTRLTHKRTRRMWQNNTNNTFIPCITPVVTKYTRWINRLLNSIPSHKAHQTIRFLNIPTDGRRIIFYFKLNSLNSDIFVFESVFFCIQSNFIEMQATQISLRNAIIMLDYSQRIFLMMVSVVIENFCWFIVSLHGMFCYYIDFVELL